MPNRSRKPDINLTAFRVMREAIARHDPDAAKPPEKKRAKKKNPAAVLLGRRGGLKGGPARAAKLSAKELSEQGRKAAEARWRSTKD